MGNQSKKLSITLQKLISSLSNDYHLDYYEENFKSSSWTNLSKKETIISDTIKKFGEHHEEFEEHRINSLFEYFQKIVINDSVIYFEKVYIYKELYKILNLINITFSAQILLNDSSSYPDGFAVIQSDLEKVKSFRKQYQNNLFGLRKIVGKGQSRFRYWFTSIYIKNKTLARFFTYLFLTSNLDAVKKSKEDKEEHELLLVELEFFLMQHTSISKVIKSFGILLYWEMIEYLEVNKKNSEEYTSHIIYELFRENFNAHELHKHIEIKSSLGYLPIFGASKKANLKEDEKQFIQKKLLEQIQETSSITEKEFKPFFEKYIKTPHIQFLEKYPVELFQINQKYSS